MTVASRLVQLYLMISPECYIFAFADTSEEIRIMVTDTKTALMTGFSPTADIQSGCIQPRKDALVVFPWEIFLVESSVKGQFGSPSFPMGGSGTFARS